MGRSRKMKRNRKTRKNRKRGGHLVMFDHNIVRDNYILRLGVHSGDCVPSVFYFLGYSNRDDSLYLANKYPTGLDGPDIIRLLDAAYQTSHSLIQINHIQDLDNLPPDCATLATIGKIEHDGTGEGWGHAIVIYRDTHNNCFIHDPQNMTAISYTVVEYLKYINSVAPNYGLKSDGTIGFFHILISDKIYLNTDNRINIPLIDEVFHDLPISRVPSGMGFTARERQEANEAAANLAAAQAPNSFYDVYRKK